MSDKKTAEENTPKQLKKDLQEYINAKHNQDECIGFIQGWNISNQQTQELQRQVEEYKNYIKTQKFTLENDLGYIKILESQYTQLKSAANEMFKCANGNSEKDLYIALTNYQLTQKQNG